MDSQIEAGRRATVHNACLAYQQGASYIVLTGNPMTKVANQGIKNAISAIKDELGDNIAIIAGKMHAAGVGKEAAGNLITEEDVQDFITAGADVIMVPAPGTIPGIMPEFVRRLSEIVHLQERLLMTAIGTSQEGAELGTIQSIAMYSKMAGADIHHLGDAGYVGIAIPENIMGYSIAIRGRRHTYRRMAMQS